MLTLRSSHGLGERPGKPEGWGNHRPSPSAEGGGRAAYSSLPYHKGVLKDWFCNLLAFFNWNFKIKNSTQPRVSRLKEKNKVILLKKTFLVAEWKLVSSEAFSFPKGNKVHWQQSEPGPWASSLLCLCRGLFCSFQHPRKWSTERLWALEWELLEGRDSSRFR